MCGWYKLDYLVTCLCHNNELMARSPQWRSNSCPCCRRFPCRVFTIANCTRNTIPVTYLYCTVPTEERLLHLYPFAGTVQCARDMTVCHLLVLGKWQGERRDETRRETRRETRLWGVVIAAPIDLPSTAAVPAVSVLSSPLNNIDTCYSLSPSPESVPRHGPSLSPCLAPPLIGWPLKTCAKLQQTVFTCCKQFVLLEIKLHLNQVQLGYYVNPPCMFVDTFS